MPTNPIIEADDSIMKMIWPPEIGTTVLNEIITGEYSRFNWNGNFQGEKRQLTKLNIDIRYFRHKRNARFVW